MIMKDCCWVFFFASCPHELLMWPVSQDLNALDSLRFDAPVLALCVDDFPLHFIRLASKKKERPIFIVGSWSGHSGVMSHMRWMMDTYRWQVAQRRFFVHQHSGNLPRNAQICAMKSILGVLCRRLEDVHHEF